MSLAGHTSYLASTLEEASADIERTLGTASSAISTSLNTGVSDIDGKLVETADRLRANLDDATQPCRNARRDLRHHRSLVDLGINEIDGKLAGTAERLRMTLDDATGVLADTHGDNVAKIAGTVNDGVREIDTRLVDTHERIRSTLDDRTQAITLSLGEARSALETTLTRTCDLARHFACCQRGHVGDEPRRSRRGSAQGH